MPQTAENVAREFGIERDAQDRATWHLPARRKRRKHEGPRLSSRKLLRSLSPIGRTDQSRSPATSILVKHHWRKLAALNGIVVPDGSVTAGNASGVNDGAAALLIASESAARSNRLEPKARIIAMATAGVAPRIMGDRPSTRIRACAARSQAQARSNGCD